MDNVNVELKENFSQVCVWPGCGVLKCEEPHTIEEFEKLMMERMKTRVQYLEEIETKPDTDSTGSPVPGTGGRIDLFFAVHNEDIGHFAIPRMTVGIRWIEDVLSSCNYHSRIYPERVFDYCSWNEEALAK